MRSLNFILTCSNFIKLTFNPPVRISKEGFITFSEIAKMNTVWREALAGQMLANLANRP